MTDGSTQPSGADGSSQPSGADELRVMLVALTAQLAAHNGNGQVTKDLAIACSLVERAIESLTQDARH